ncbi:replication protein [Rouxiella badensis]|uniref:replication protein n=1 Tax=Rouxiella badensis TaxID=1646377 RepID=UPI00037C0A64
MNTAEILQFPSDTGGQERRVVDTDNGYTRIANELLEAVIGSGLTQNQLLITLAIIRKTYGYNKTADWVGNAQLSELTGLPETRCSTERNKLVKMNILTLSGRVVGINKEISSWQTKFNGISKPFTESVNKTFTESVNLTESVNFTEPVKKTFTESVKGNLQNLLNTKDNITKDNKDIIKTPISPFMPKAKSFDPLSIPIPEWLNADAWKDWVNNRAETKKPIKTERAVSMAFKLLKECLDEGYNPTDVINASIANGWQGLFKPKFPARKNVTVTQVNKPMNHIPEGFTG